MPRFTYHGFRYAEVSGVKGLKPGDIKAAAVRNAVAVRSSFSCGSELVNRIQNMCLPRIPGALPYAEGLVKSVKGDVKAGWKKEGGGVRMNVTVPFNSSCRLVLPLRNSVTVNQGRREIQNQNGEAFVMLESGVYDIINT
jgi:hypothetical protein